MTTTPETDQVAEVLARVARANRINCTGMGEVGCEGRTGWHSWTEHHQHVAAEQAAALRAAGLVVEGTEVEEWGVRFDGRDGVDLMARSVVEIVQPGHGITGVRRTRTRYPDRVTEWVAVDEGGE